MIERGFVRQLAPLGLALVAGATVEALLVVVRADGRPVARLIEGCWTMGLWALPCAAAAGLLAALVAAFFREESVIEATARALRGGSRRDLAGVLLLAMSSVVLTISALARPFFRFHNIELAALLLAALVLGVVVLAATLSLLLLRWCAARRAALRPLPAFSAGLVVCLLGMAGAVLSAKSGLAQLDGRLALPPLATLTAWAFAERGALLVAGRRAGALGVALLTALIIAWLSAPAGAAAVLAARGAWTPYLITLLRAATDVDRDGYSSLLGGGDCAPLDPGIHPGAAEVSGDGVDNNCIGGDGGRAVLPRRPSWGMSAHGSPSNLNVVVVTIETLRHDHASFVKAARDTTPNLRALASESLVFERMYSAAPFTRIALATLFSSYAPSEIDWQPQPPEKRMRRIGPRTPWLPELLSARGYATIAVLTDFSAFTKQEDAGFDRGFSQYDVSTRLRYRGGTMWGFPAAEQVDKALERVRQSPRPFFLWVHLFEPHYTYEQPPHAPHFGDDDQARYDAEIWHADHQVGRLIDGLRELGVWDKTLLLALGDHGESFGEHDDRWHGSNLFDPQLRPAALLRIPGVPGKRIDASVGFTDIAPTLARLLGDRVTFDRLRGRSLTPLLHHGSLPEDDNVLIAETFSVSDGQAYQAAVIAYPLKLIYEEAGRRFAMYDLRADPREKRPIDPTADARGRPLLDELIGYLERTRPRALPRASPAP